jgi:hypothetical protein
MILDLALNREPQIPIDEEPRRWTCGGPKWPPHSGLPGAVCDEFEKVVTARSVGTGHLGSPARAPSLSFFWNELSCKNPTGNLTQAAARRQQRYPFARLRLRPPRPSRTSRGELREDSHALTAPRSPRRASALRPPRLRQAGLASVVPGIAARLVTVIWSRARAVRRACGSGRRT